MKDPLSLLKYSLEYAHFLFAFKLKDPQLKISKGKKNILCIVPNLAVGGAERVILNIAKTVNRKNYCFHIIPTMPSDHTWHKQYSEYFENTIIPVKRASGQFLLNKYFYELIRRLNIDTILISNSTRGYRFLPQIKSKFSYLKTIDILHAEKNVGTTIGLKESTPYLDKRVCISNHIKNYMLRNYKKLGVRAEYAERLVVIHNGIDLKKYNPKAQARGKFKAQFNIPKNTKIISFVGRFDPVKNTLLFVEIAKKLIEKVKDHKLKFVMAGEGPELQKTKNVVNKQNLQDYFVFTGAIDNVPALLADTYLLLITSKCEGIPLAALEAMATGTPVVSTNVGGISELIKNNVNGFLVDPKNNLIEQFTNNTLEFLSGKINYKKLAKSARKTIVSEYSLEIIGAKYQKVFDELLAS